MNDDQLGRALQSVGMTCFIRYISVFADPRIDRTEAAECLRTAESYSSRSCASRVSHARRIIHAGRSRDAVTMIAGSKLDGDAIALAKQWLATHA